MNWRKVSNCIHRNWMRLLPTGPIEIGSREELLFLGNEFAGEVGELCNIIKKIARDGRTEVLVGKAYDELGDARIMLHHIAEVLGMSEEDAAYDKTIKNMTRDDWPNMLIEDVRDRGNDELFDG